MNSEIPFSDNGSCSSVGEQDLGWSRGIGSKQHLIKSTLSSITLACRLVEHLSASDLLISHHIHGHHLAMNSLFIRCYAQLKESYRVPLSVDGMSGACRRANTKY